MARNLTCVAALALLVLSAASVSAQDGLGMMMPAGASRSQPAGTDAWVGGAAYYLLGTFGENNAAFTSSVFGPGGLTSTTTSFPSDFTSAAAFWVGKTFASGIGIQVRYFFRVESPNSLTSTITPASNVLITAAAAPALPPGPVIFAPGVLLRGSNGADNLSFQRSLNIHAIDLEATFQQNIGRWAAQLTGGGRFMYLNQDYTARLVNDVATGVLSESNVLAFTRRFNGGGPTASLQLQAPILGAALFGYATARGSVLAGGMRDDLTSTQTVTDTGGTVGGSSAQTNATNSFHSIVIPVAELEVGVQVGRSVGGFPAVIRGGLVSQTYFNAGTASDRAGNLHLLGLQASLTLSY